MTNFKEKMFRFIFPEKHEAMLELQDNVNELLDAISTQINMTYQEQDAKIRAEEELEDAEVRVEYLEGIIVTLKEQLENSENEVEQAEYEISKLESEVSDLKDVIYELENREEE